MPRHPDTFRRSRRAGASRTGLLRAAVVAAGAAGLPALVAPPRLLAADAPTPRQRAAEEAIEEAIRRRRAEQVRGAQGRGTPAEAAANRERRAGQLKAMRDDAADLPKLHATRIEDVIQVKVGPDGRLAVATPAADAEPTKATEYQVVVDGFAGGPAVLDVDSVTPARASGPRPAPKPAPGKSGRRVVFTGFNGTDPDALATISIDASPASFAAARQVQRNEGTDIVQLTDQRDPSAPGGGAVMLRVIRSGEAVAQPVGLNIQEPDFPTLLREHPAEAQAYVRPLLRELGQDHLFAPDWKTAWQVLADAWPADPAATAAVAAVLPRLADPDFRRRDKALSELLALDRKGATALRRVDRSTLSAEQSRLVGLALAPYNQLSGAEAIRLGADSAFLLDCLHVDDPDIRQAAVNRLTKVLRRDDLTTVLSGSDADRRAAIRRLRQAATAGAPSTADDASTRPATR